MAWRFCESRRNHAGDRGRREHRGGRWFIRNRGVLHDGRTATMVNVMKPVDDKSFTWQTIDRTAAGELLPNIDEIVVVRQ